MTIAREFIEEMAALRNRYGIIDSSGRTLGEYGEDGRQYAYHATRVMERYYGLELRRESHYDISIGWYRDGSATWVGEHSEGIAIWMDEGMEGYAEAKRFFAHLPWIELPRDRHINYAFRVQED